ncbi:MAG: TonB family protein [Terriglobia bacterium]
MPSGNSPLAPQGSPRLELRWSHRGRELSESLRALRTRLPLLPARATRVAFRDAAVRPHWVGRAFVASIAWHIAFVVFPWPESLFAPPAPSADDVVRIEFDLSWSDKPLVLPAITPRPQTKRSPSAPPEQPAPPRPADTRAPQTIISDPPAPNHPTQTIVRPLALEDIRARAQNLELPNLVIPSPPTAAPEVQLRPERLPDAPLGPRTTPDPVVPRPLTPAELALRNSRLENLMPRLTLPEATSDAAAAPAPEADAPAMAPASRPANLPGLVALSARPVLPRPVVELPKANLRARFIAGPDAAPRPAEGEGGGEGGLHVPGVSIAPAGEVPTGPVMTGPPGEASVPPPPKPALPEDPRPQASAEPVRVERSPEEIQRRAEEMLEGIRPGEFPDATNTLRRIYTIYVNMPNLTSQSGSWVLRFAELNGSTLAGGAADDFPLEAPVAVKKVDPRYPGPARRQRIEGTVFLYGIIRRDGSVDGVHIVRKLHDALDKNAVAAFQRWEFEPGRKNGLPVDLEVVIEIPFRLSRLF